MRDGIGRRQHGGDDEHADHREFPPRAQHVIVDDADLAEQRQHHRQLEAQAKGQDQHHDEIEIGLDIGHQLDRRLAITAGARRQRIEEVDGSRQQEEIDQRRTQHEKYRCRHEIGPEGILLVTVKPRRHEAVNLHGDQREGDEQAAEETDLDFHQKDAEQLDGNQRRVGARAPFEGQHEIMQEIRGKYEADNESQDEADHTEHQPLAQLDQMLDQGRFRGVDVVLGHVRSYAAGRVSLLAVSASPKNFLKSSSALFLSSTGGFLAAGSMVPMFLRP